MQFLRLSFAIAFVCSGSLSAADLASVERKIVKEPRYAGKPKYGLLVFGPEAKTRVWLAIDGDKLWVDRNGNGDLTDDGPAIEAEIVGEGDGASKNFVIPEIMDGKRVHKTISLQAFSLKFISKTDQDALRYIASRPDALGFKLGGQIDIPGRKGGGLDGRILHVTNYRDLNGFLQFADTPAAAPIVHFGGSWSIFFLPSDELTFDRQTDIYLAVGTPGTGPGTTTYVGYEYLVPDNLHPEAEFTFPPKMPGNPPIRERYVLKERC